MTSSISVLLECLGLIYHKWMKNKRIIITIAPLTIKNRMNRHPDLIQKTINFVVLALLLTSVVASCGVSRDGKMKKEQTGFVFTFPHSPRATQFTVLLNEEVSPGQLSDRFVPSEELTDKFALEKASRGFILNGLIKTDDLFDADGLKQLGVELSPAKGRMMTIRVPLGSFVQFLQQPGIVYFDLSKPVYPRTRD